MILIYIDIDDLILWKVYKSIFVNCSLKEKLNKLNFVNEESLLPMDKLQEVFSESPVPKYLHIIVRVPPAGECKWLSTFIIVHDFSSYPV